MSRPLGSGVWTYDEFARLPEDGNRYEVLDGEVLVTPKPSPQHQRFSGRLYRLLADFVEAHGLGEVFYEVDLLFGGGTFLAPDLLVVAAGDEAGITTRGIECVPALVVEVLSPSSEKHDRITKPSRYLEFGVREYWLVDPPEGAVWVWTSADREPRRESGTVRWRIMPEAPVLEIEIGPLVRPGR